MIHFGKSVVIAMVTAGLLSSVPAFAGDSTLTVDKVSVFYGDLDLSRQAGAEMLFTRLKTAAIQACGGRPDSRDLAGAGHFRDCQKTALDSAVTRLGNAKVAALYGQTVEQVAAK